MKLPSRRLVVIRILLIGFALGVAVWIFNRPPKSPATPRINDTLGKLEKIEQKAKRAAESAAAKPADPEHELVRSLLAENLSERTFSFAAVAEATSGKKVIPLDDSEAHRRVVTAIDKALSSIIPEMSRPQTPVQSLSRINEASRFFEDALLEKLNASPGLRCDIPPTKAGARQRSGYPDLRITDTASGTVFYLDPKLVAADSTGSTFRTFYFEPKDGTLKITDDAVHLLVGIEHDGRPGQWRFTGWRLVDVSKLRVRLKAEFQASNADLYRETKLSLPGGDR